MKTCFSYWPIDRVSKLMFENYCICLCFALIIIRDLQTICIILLSRVNHEGFLGTSTIKIKFKNKFGITSEKSSLQMYEYILSFKIKQLLYSTRYIKLMLQTRHVSDKGLHQKVMYYKSLKNIN